MPEEEKMSEKVDAVVIGAGFSGPIAGAYLAKSGLKTVIFERTGRIGGPKFSSYTKRGFHSIVCAHLPIFYTAKDGTGWWPLAAAETGAAITWEHLPNTALYQGGRTLVIPFCTSGEAFVKFLTDLAPVPLPDATQKALKKCWDAAMAMPEEKLWSAEIDTMPCGVWLDSITDDTVAKQLLATMSSLLAVLPAEDVFEHFSTSMLVGALFASWSGRLTSIATIGDTEDSILKAFCDVVIKNGGQVLTRHKVSRVIVEEGEARGVVVSDASGKEKTYEAKHVIAGVDYHSIKPLLKEKLPAEIEEIINGLDTWRTTSIDVHFGLKRQIVSSRWMQLVVMGDAGEYRGCIIIPSHFEPLHAPPGKQLLHAEVFVPTPKYKERPLEQWVQELTDMVEEVYPGVKAEIEMTHTYTLDRSIHHAFKPVRKIPLRCPGISNLYFTGDYTQAPGLVVERAAASAMIVAKNILGSS